MATVSDKSILDSINAAIKNAADQQAKATSVKEAQEWQGIINQQVQAKRDLKLDE